MSIVTLTFDLWPPKSIGCILSSRLTCLPSLIKKSTTVKSLLCSQAYFHRCPVWPWPLTSKINRVHPLITVNMSCKFDKEICNGLVSVVFTSVTIKKVWLSDRQTHARTHRQTPDKVIPMCRYASQATQKVIPMCRYASQATQKARIQMDGLVVWHHIQWCFSYICDGTYMCRRTEEVGQALTP